MEVSVYVCVLQTIYNFEDIFHFDCRQLSRQKSVVSLTDDKEGKDGDQMKIGEVLIEEEKVETGKVNLAMTN
jgi:hypothetical protein